MLARVNLHAGGELVRHPRLRVLHLARRVFLPVHIKLHRGHAPRRTGRRLAWRAHTDVGVQQNIPVGWEICGVVEDRILIRWVRAGLQVFVFGDAGDDAHLRAVGHRIIDISVLCGGRCGRGAGGHEHRTQSPRTVRHSRFGRCRRRCALCDPHLDTIRGWQRLTIIARALRAIVKCEVVCSDPHHVDTRVRRVPRGDRTDHGLVDIRLIKSLGP